MAATNVSKSAASTSKKTTTTTAKASGGHSPLLQFTIGFLLILVASWFSNISDDTGNVGATLFTLFWILWLMNNSSKLKGLLS